MREEANRVRTTNEDLESGLFPPAEEAGGVKQERI
jgi:hypothetical protein